MGKGFKIQPDGSFYIGNQYHRIPDSFSSRQIHSFRTLLEPIPDMPTGTTLTTEQRRRQEDYFMRRALSVVIPGLPEHLLREAPSDVIREIHGWIIRHRPELAGQVETVVK